MRTRGAGAHELRHTALRLTPATRTSADLLHNPGAYGRLLAALRGYLPHDAASMACRTRPMIHVIAGGVTAFPASFTCHFFGRLRGM